MARSTFDFIVFDAQRQVTRALSKRIEAVPKAMKKGARRAINRTLTTARKEASQAIRSDLALKAADIKDRITKKVVWDYEGRLEIRDRRLELIKFGSPKQVGKRVAGKRTRRGGKAGVTVRIYKGKPRTYIPGAFIQKGLKSGRLHVLKRRGPERDTAEILYGPSLANTAERHLPRILARTQPVFEKNLAHEIDYALSKL